MMPTNFWRATALGVVLSDVTLVSGFGGANSSLVADIRADPLEETSEHFAVRGLMFADEATLQRWATDAEPFIRDGRVMYSPRKCVAYFSRDPEGAKRRDEPVIRAIDLPDVAQWTVTSALLESARDHSVELYMTERSPLAEAAAILEIALPYISNITLRKLHRVLEDESDTLSNFRAAFAQAIPQYKQVATSAISRRELEPHRQSNQRRSNRATSRRTDKSTAPCDSCSCSSHSRCCGRRCYYRVNRGCISAAVSSGTGCSRCGRCRLTGEGVR